MCVDYIRFVVQNTLFTLPTHTHNIFNGPLNKMNEMNKRQNAI